MNLFLGTRRDDRAGDPSGVRVRAPGGHGRGQAPAPQRRRPGGRTLLGIFVAGVLALLVAPWILRQLPRASDLAEYQFPTRSLRLVPAPPSWVSPTLLDEALALGNLPDTVSLLDERLTANLARAFRQHPWVARVVRVRRTREPGIVVELEYRRPAALVERQGGLLPVDVEGVLLPPSASPHEAAEALPVVRGIVSAAPPAPGQRWDDPLVAGAAALAAVLAPHWDEFQLSAIEPPTAVTPEQADDGEYVLTTRGGSRILWGRSPGNGHPGELSPEQKIGRLQACIDRYGGFDQPQGPYEIDIRHWKEIVKRPLQASGVARPPLR